VKEHRGILDRTIIEAFPSQRVTKAIPTWVANWAGLEECLAVASLLAPAFYEVENLIVWDVNVARKLERDGLISPFGNDPATLEKYWNIFNLAEFNLLEDIAAQEEPLSVEAFGRVIHHYWSRALVERFPDRWFEFEIRNAMFDEAGLCLTFWQVRL
jgi:hypothetical protein